MASVAGQMRIADCHLKSLGVDVEGIFTHFATADEADDSKFKCQLTSSRIWLSTWWTGSSSLVIMLATATSIWHAETVFNAVRSCCYLWSQS